MAKFNFKVSSAPAKKATPKPKQVKIQLEKHETVMKSNEMYTYIGNDGEEHQYLGILTKSENDAFGKIFENHKVDLIYHPEIKSVEPCDEYFTYEDAYGNQCVFNGNVEYDLDRNTYIGLCRDKEVKEKMIQIFEEK